MTQELPTICEIPGCSQRDPNHFTMMGVEHTLCSDHIHDFISCLYEEARFRKASDLVSRKPRLSVYMIEKEEEVAAG